MSKAKKTKPSTDCTLAELAKKVKADKSFPAEYVRLFVSRVRAPHVTDAECITLAEGYAAEVLAKRDTDSPSPDDPVAREAIALRDSQTVADKVLEETEDKEKADAQYKVSLDHRVKASARRVERAIAQHLAQYPEPKGAA